MHLRLEERRGYTKWHATSRHRYGHQPKVIRQVIQLPAVGAPARFVTAVDGDGPWTSWGLKRWSVDGNPARLVGAVGDKTSVGREVGVHLLAWGLHDPDRIGRVSHRQQPDVGGFPTRERQALSIGRPVCGKQSGLSHAGLARDLFRDQRL